MGSHPSLIPSTVLRRFKPVQDDQALMDDDEVAGDETGTGNLSEIQLVVIPDLHSANRRTGATKKVNPVGDCSDRGRAWV